MSASLDSGVLTIVGTAGNDLLKGKDGAMTDHLDGGDGYDTIERDRSLFSVVLFGGKIRTDAFSNAEVVQ